MQNTDVRLYFSALAMALCLALVHPVAAQQLTGAGSTFVYPVMSRWAEDFQHAHPSVSINYQSVGSGAGIEQVRNKTVDFGASDVALSDAQLQQMPAVVQVPESAGPVCITYNLPELHQPLRLSAEALSGIYLGTITDWSDAAIAASNPGVNLPHRAILVVHRSDGSGTTGIFSTYLSAVNPVWRDKVGHGTALDWPVGLGGKGSEGVTGLVKQTVGGIGYVELTYATENHLPVVLMRNRSGEYVAPSAAAAAAAMNAFRPELARDVRTPIVDGLGAGVYPISGFTFLILPQDGSDRAKRQALKNFVHYVLTAGQTQAAELGYAPLPASIQQLDARLLGQLTAGGQPLR